MEPSKQYRIWQFIAASARPVSCAEIAVGIGVSEVSVRSVVWNIAHRNRAIRNVGGHRGSRSGPLWMANPDVVLPPAGAQNKLAAEGRADARKVQRYDTQASGLSKWPPCELARIYGLEAGVGARGARAETTAHRATANATGAV